MSATADYAQEFIDGMNALKGDENIVVLMYQSFCDPCNAMKPQVEALAAKYGFGLLKINCDDKVDPKHAGTVIPSITAYKFGEAFHPLRGARTTEAIMDYLVDTGMVEAEAA